jgi:hypothetical protein
LGSCFVVLATMRPPFIKSSSSLVVHDDPQAVFNVQFGCKVHSRVIGVRLWSCRQGGRTGSEGSDAGVRRNGALDLHI